MHDDHGQPINYACNSFFLNDRTIDELVGLARGILADGSANIKEAQFLLAWLESNAKYANDRIINSLFSRIKAMLSDNLLDKEEEDELLSLLRSITGEQLPEHNIVTTAASFPLDKPAPAVKIENKYFCLTGKFVYGPRRICEEAIIERGGFIKTSISDWVDYLVIGTLSSDQWMHTSYGRKIEYAMKRRDSPTPRTYGEKIAIIHEDHWAKYMFQE
ncbi:MAG: hypothetical protein VR65_06070 [Desulfobulbaceae bacterium BRH_c16a]|nr:MAG: hypothetical protein VR65_06070 [Desulfobulbaceae bacterium BRH_c16a]